MGLGFQPWEGRLKIVWFKLWSFRKIAKWASSGLETEALNPNRCLRGPVFRIRTLAGANPPVGWAHPGNRCLIFGEKKSAREALTGLECLLPWATAAHPRNSPTEFRGAMSARGPGPPDGRANTPIPPSYPHSSSSRQRIFRCSLHDPSTRPCW